MIRSRMLTYGFRLYFGLAVAFFGAAFLSALGGGIVNSDQGAIDNVLGPLTVGWKGGVGNHVAFTALLTASAGAGFIASMLIAFRDADADALAQVAQVESVPLTRAPFGVSFAPLAIALLSVGLIIGFAAGSPLAYLAGIGITGAAFVWLVRAWSNRATGDDLTNSEIYHQFMGPLRLPVVSAIIIGFVILGLSRILLAVSHDAAIAVFSGVAVLFFVAAIFISSRPKMSSGALTLAVVLGALLVLALAIAGLIAGERDFHEHESSAPSAITSEVHTA